MVSLRNLQKVVSASSFAAKTHNFLLANYGHTIAPASLYFSPKDLNLQSGHSHDPFTLALLASELTRENRILSTFLQGITEDVKQEALKNEFSEKINENTDYINSYTRELAAQLRSKTFDFPVETCSNAIYAFEHNNASQKDLYQQILFPLIKQKLEFLSFQGLARLISGLLQAKSLEDKSLLNAVLARLREKVKERQAREFVGFSAWKLDRYETSAGKNAAGSEIQELKEKCSGSLGALKHWLRVNWAFLQNNLLFRALYRESRVQRQFYEENEGEIVEGLVKDLEKLAAEDKNSDLKGLIEGLRK